MTSNVRIARIANGWLRIVILAALIWGCLIRFHDLGAEVYWEDETFTSLRVAGYLRQELTDTYFQGQVIYPADLKRFQIINHEKDWADTVASLADDVHPPGYFALLRLWAERVGSEPVAMRSFSAVLSLLLLPAAYWLSRELFSGWPYERQVAEIAAALVAVSPYHIKMAGEARMYSLWPVLTTLAGVLLLRALRCDGEAFQRNRKLNWSLYSLAGMMSLYVHWFSVLVLMGHSLYVFSTQGRYWTRMHSRYVCAVAAIGAAILPWLVFVGHRLSNVYAQTTWTSRTMGSNGGWPELTLLFQQWLDNAAFLFVHIDIFPAGSMVQRLGVWVVIGIIGLSMVWVIRHSPRAVWLFLLIEAWVIFLPLAISDLTLGGSRSVIFRYLAPSFVAIEIMVAFCLASLFSRHLQSRHFQSRHFQPFWSGDWGGPEAGIARVALIALLLGGALSNTLVKRAFDPLQQPLFQVATVLQSVPHSRLVSDTRPSRLMPLVHLLASPLTLEPEGDIQFQFTVRPEIPDLSIAHTKGEDRTVFLYDASGTLQAAVQAQGYRLSPVLGLEDMQKLEPKR
jgi:uncharacterized membrane protein